MRGLLRVIFGGDKDSFLAAMDKIREYCLAYGGEITQPDLMEIFERLKVTRSGSSTVVVPAVKKTRPHRRFGTAVSFSRKNDSILPPATNLVAQNSAQPFAATAHLYSKPEETALEVVPLDD